MDKKCYRCGSQFRLTQHNNDFICFECEKDVALKSVGIVRD
jgi:DNA-directed RNA polymerase subunit RPC12/RpoP